MIPTITLGDNLTVSKLGFGGMAVTDTYGSTPDEVAKQAIHTALDAGITFIDTAERLRRTPPQHHRPRRHQ